MKRLFLMGFCTLLVSGCASVPTAPSAGVISQDVMQKQFISTSQLHKGLSRAQVSELLGKEVVSGYALVDQLTEEYKPITVANPKRSETIKVNNRTYNVDYYLVGIKVADDKISDDELVPVVFENDRLVGCGWDFFNMHLKVR